MLDMTKMFSKNQLFRWMLSENRCMSAAVYKVQNRLENAEIAWLQAMQIAPDYWKPYYGICTQVYLPQGRVNEAKKMLQEYMRLTGENANERIEQLLERHTSTSNPLMSTTPPVTSSDSTKAMSSLAPPTPPQSSNPGCEL